MSWLDDFGSTSNPTQQEPLLGNGWARGLALLGAAIRDMSDARQGRQGSALLGVQQMIRQDQLIGKKQAEENSQKSAQAALLGGLDPATGITWNQPRQGTSVDDQKALFMRAFPEAGAKAAAASLFPKPLDPKDRYMAVGDSLVDLTKPGAGPVYQAPSPFLFPGAPGMSSASGGTGGTTTSVQPTGPAGGADPAQFPADLDMKVSMMEEKYGLPAGAFRSLVQAESGGRPGVVSPKGAMGYTQLMPGTAKDLGVDPSNPDQNLEGGARYLKQQLDKYGNLDHALVAYNWGPGNADMWIKSGADPARLPAETRGYLGKITGGGAAPVQVAQANTGTMTDAMPASPAAPAAPAGQWARPMNRKTGQMAEFEVNTATGASRPYQKAPEGYQWAGDGRLAPIPGGPKDDSGGGPFAGNAMDAQASNIVIATEQRLANGESVSPQERYTYELAKRHLMQPRVVPGPDGSLQSVAPTPLPTFPAQAAAPQAPASRPGQPAVTTIVQGQQKPTEDQSKAMGFANRLGMANDIFDRLEGQGYVVPGMYDRAASSLPLAGNYLASTEYQQLDQAKREFINAQLRRESGAVISPEEFRNAEIQYFPQPGDSPEVLEQKRQSRDLAYSNMRQASGPLSKDVRDRAAKKKAGEREAAPPTAGGLTPEEQQELDALRRKYRGG